MEELAAMVIAAEAVSFAVQHSSTPLLRLRLALCSATANVVMSWPHSGDVGGGGLNNLIYAVASFICCGRHDRDQCILEPARSSGVS
jgi:hypothetical protein